MLTLKGPNSSRAERLVFEKPAINKNIKNNNNHKLVHNTEHDEDRQRH